jgi:hypothetical protein
MTHKNFGNSRTNLTFKKLENNIAPPPNFTLSRLLHKAALSLNRNKFKTYSTHFLISQNQHFQLQISSNMHTRKCITLGFTDSRYQR